MQSLQLYPQDERIEIFVSKPCTKHMHGTTGGERNKKKINGI